MAHTTRKAVAAGYASVNFRRVRHHRARVVETAALDSLTEAGAFVRNRVRSRARGAVLPDDRDDRPNAAWDEVAYHNSNLRFHA